MMGMTIDHHMLTSTRSNIASSVEKMSLSHWGTAMIGDICSVQNGFPFKSDFFDEEEGIPLIRVRSLKAQTCDIRYRGEFDASYLVRAGDILIGMDGDFQPCLWNGGHGLLNQRVCRLVNFARGVDPYFVFQALKAPLQRIEDVAHFTTVKHLSSSTIQEVAIPLPPLPEQRAVAHVLRSVDEAIQARRREQELERERKAALMQRLFTRGTRGEPTKLTEIRQMPESWVLMRVEQAFELQLGKMLSQKARGGASPKPYMRNANVQWGRVDCSNMSEMDFSEAETQKFRLRSGDILVCEGGEVGRTALWRNELPECYFQKAIHRLRPIAAVMRPAFFAHYMERAFRLENLYGVAGTETTIAHLPQEKLAAMVIPVPPVEEQDDIVSVLDGCDSKLLALEHEQRLHEELFRALLEELMSGRLSALPLVDTVGA